METPWAGGTGDGSVVTANGTKAPLTFDFWGAKIALNVARPKKK